MRPIDWLLPVLWMVVILWFSTDTASVEHTGHWLLPILRTLAPWATPGQLEAMHGLVRKAGHLIEYGILATLWLRAFVRGRGVRPRTAAWFAVGVSLAWAVLDEAHQSLVPTRTASVVDVAIDTSGALLAVVVLRLGWRAVADRAAAVLLWVGLVVGGGFLVANHLAGVPSGALWLTVPAAALLLVARSRLARRRSDASARP